MRPAALILDSVHSVETAFSLRCASPLYSNSFEPSGMAMSPRRYCSDICRQ
jgi:hypothetical protein